MARVDFYVLGGAGESTRQVFACRLAEKAYRLDHSVHIQAADRRQAGVMDDLLWTFRDGSFLPHEVLDAATAVADAPVEAPVTIGFSDDTARPADLLINLTGELPAAIDAFPRIAEIVTSDDDQKRRGRKLFADYRSKGHSLDTHEV